MPTLTGKLWHMLDEKAVRAIADAALLLLTRTGARVEHEAMLDRLEVAGCRIDRGAHRCYFDDTLIHDAVQAMGGRPPEQNAYAPDHWNRNARISQMGSHPHLVEWPTCKRRLATADDVRDMVKLAHVLDEFEIVGQALTCSEIAPPVEPLWNAVTRMGLTTKPLGGGEVLYAQTVPYLVELGRIYSGKPSNLFAAACDFSVSPLIFGRRTVECMIEKSRHGIMHVPGTMPISGASTPVTAAGTVAVAVAELLAGWAMYFLLDPALPAGGIVASGSLDMKTGHTCFGSPEAMLQNVATIEVCRRHFGMEIWMAANYVDCKTPGINAVYAKMAPLVAAPLIGWGRMGGDGLLSAGQDYSPLQHLLELDFIQGLGQFCQGFETNPQTLAVELIDELAKVDGSSFMDSAHTLEHFRGQWHPKWLDRTSWRGDQIEQEHEKTMLADMDAYIRDAIARYEPPPVDSGKLAAARELLARAESELADISLK